MPLRLWRRLFFHLRDSLRACSRLLRASLQLDLDLDAGGELQGHQGLHGLGGGLEDVDEALMGAALELLAGILVLMDGAQDGHDLLLGGQGDGAGHGRAGALGGAEIGPVHRAGAGAGNDR